MSQNSDLPSAIAAALSLTKSARFEGIGTGTPLRERATAMRRVSPPPDAPTTEANSRARIAMANAGMNLRMATSSEQSRPLGGVAMWEREGGGPGRGGEGPDRYVPRG